jgi:GT2 family glycosyltransferase
VTTLAAPASRNAPCPCGSGRRYKECHGALAATEGVSGGAEEALAAPVPLASLLARALADHQAGRLDAAAHGYEAALACEPAHFDALHMLGVVHFQRAEFDRARSLIVRALELRPEVAAAQRNLRLVDNALRRLGAQERYRRWIEGPEAAEVAARAALRSAVAARPDAPRLSILLPTFDSPAAPLRACLESVLVQDYPHWELCIADDASRAPHVKDILEAQAARDDRIRVRFRPANGHIAAASNTALELARGDYVVLLDHDDTLAPHALGEVAAALVERPGTAILYSDEDKIDEAGQRFEPYFKPDWNPLLLTSQNYVSHLGVYRTDLVRAVGGFREGTEGAQDWDLLLRCAERVQPDRIVHVPRVLYHWRAIEGSTARAMEGKHYAAAAQEKVVADLFARRGRQAAIRRVMWDTFLQADVIAEAPSALVLVLGGMHGNAAAWSALAAASGGRCEVVPAAAVPLDGRPRALPRSVAMTLNRLAGDAREGVLVVVDAASAPPSADAFARWRVEASLPESGPVGALRLDANRDLAGTALVLDPAVIGAAPWLGEPEGFWGMAGRAAVKQNVAAVSIDGLAIRLALWRSLGGLEVTAFANRYQDVDLCLRAAAAGARAAWHPAVVLADARPILPGPADADTGEDAREMRRRWAPMLARDPAYHPALDRAPRLFELPAGPTPASPP